MRISTAAFYDKGVSSLQERQRTLYETQEHLSAEKRVLRASDDPAAAARAERAQARIARSDAQQRSVEASRSSMTQAESTLGNATGLLQEALTAIVQAGGAGVSDSERSGIAQQLQSIRSQLGALAGQRDAAGNPLFGDSKTSSTASQVTAGGEALPLTVDGTAAWYQAPDGNGLFKATNDNSTTAWADAGGVTDPSAFFNATTKQYQIAFSGSGSAMTYTVSKDGVPGTPQPWTPAKGSDTTQSIEFDGMRLNIGGTPASGDTFTLRPSQPALSVFDALDSAIKGLTDSKLTKSQATQALQDGLAGVNGSLTALGSLRSRVGEALNHADAAEDRIATGKLQAQQDRSNAEDLDPLKAVSDLQQQQTNYDVALKTYSMVQKLSLFQYISG